VGKRSYVSAAESAIGALRRSGSMSGKAFEPITSDLLVGGFVSRRMLRSSMAVADLRVLRDRCLHPKAVHSEYQHVLKARDFVITSFANREPD
jgi:hypothetical protein